MGIFAIHKPVGPTSHDIINALRKITGEKRIGHAGTLDPLASGVLVVAIGREATRTLSKIVQKEKAYETTVMLGVTSTTDDAEGEKTEHDIHKIPTQEEVVAVVKHFVGNIQQKPPQFSAVKIHGKPAYKHARKGEAVTLGLRNVSIKEIQILSYSWPCLQLRVVTGPGVYIRSLARDIGEMLGVGGYVQALERMRVGQYTFKNAVTLEQFAKDWKKA